MYKINPLILNRWSPKSMSGEELSDDDMLSLFEAQDGHPLLLIINRGDLFMLKEIQKNGTGFSI